MAAVPVLRETALVVGLTKLLLAVLAASRRVENWDDTGVIDHS